LFRRLYRDAAVVVLSSTNDLAPGRLPAGQQAVRAVLERDVDRDRERRRIHGPDHHPEQRRGSETWARFGDVVVRVP
jgi:hypothetical protein